MTSPSRMNVPATAAASATVTRTSVQDVPATRTAPKWKLTDRSETVIQSALGEVRELSNLEQNWDSYGGEPPSRQAIENASELLLTVQFVLGKYVGEKIEPEYVAPRADGGVQIEWVAGLLKVSVEVGSSGDLSYLFVDKTSGTRQSEERHVVSPEAILQRIATVVFTVDDEHLF